MRKIVLILSVFIATSMGANAYVDNMYMTSEQYMMNTGYSKEMSKMIAITNQDPYREPADSDHPYGHGKYEDMAGFIEGIKVGMRLAGELNIP